MIKFLTSICDVNDFSFAWNIKEKGFLSRPLFELNYFFWRFLARERPRLNIKLISVLIALMLKRAIIIPPSDKSKPEKKKKTSSKWFAIEL